MTDEPFYSRVVEELVQAGPIPGLWAKAFAESDGDETKSKALYLRLRVEQLKLAYESEKRAQMVAQQIAERARIEAVQREKAEIDAKLIRETEIANAALPFYKRKVPDDIARFLITLALLLLIFGIAITYTKGE